MSDAPGEPAGGDSSLPAAPLTRREAAEARRDADTEVVAETTPDATAPVVPAATESADSGPVVHSHLRAKRW